MAIEIRETIVTPTPSGYRVQMHIADASPPDAPAPFVVSIAVEIPKPQTEQLFQMTAIWLFETNLPVRDYCEKDVAPAQRALFVGDFEMTPEIRIGRI